MQAPISSPLALTSKFERRIHWYILTAIVLGSLLLRIHLALHCSLWADELFSYWDSKNASWGEILAGQANPHHPMFNFAMIKATLRLTGNLELNLRLYSLVFGCVALVAIYLMCRKFQIAALPSLLIVFSLSLSRIFLRNATQARPYSAYLAFVILLILVVRKIYLDPKKWIHWTGLVGFSLLACLTHYAAICYVPFFWGLLFAGLGYRYIRKQLPWQPSILYLAISAGGFLLLFYLLVIPGLKTMIAHPETTTGIRELQLPTQFFYKCMSNFLWPGLPGTTSWRVFQAILVLIGFILLFIDRKKERFFCIVTVASVVLPFFIVGMVSTNHFIDPRYIIPSYVGYNLAFAFTVLYMIEQVWKRLQPEKRTTLLIGLCLLFAIPLGPYLSSYPSCFFYLIGHHDYKSFSPFIRDQIPEEIPAVIIQDRGWKDTGVRLFKKAYPVGRKVRHLTKYRLQEAKGQFLFIEFRITPGREKEFDKLLRKHFGISLEEYRAEPYLNVPSSKYQPRVKAKLIELPKRE